MNLSHIYVIPLVPTSDSLNRERGSSSGHGAHEPFTLLLIGYAFHQFMRLRKPRLQTIFAPSLKQTIMKGKYINTVIMMAALSGNRNKRAASEKETITSLNDHKIIWSKNGRAKATASAKPSIVLL